MDNNERRRLLFIEQGGLCYICGGRMQLLKEFPLHMFASFDHVIPLSRGGTWARGNVRLAHRSCNAWKGSRSLEDLPALGSQNTSGDANAG